MPFDHGVNLVRVIDLRQMSGGGGAIADFTAWLADAGRETEQFMLDWATSKGWSF